MSSTTIVLSWGPPPTAHQNGIIRKYIITAMEVDTGYHYTWEAYTTELELHSLHPFYTYQFTIAAFTVGQGPMSSPLSLQTLEDGKCKSFLSLIILCHHPSISIVPSAPPQNVTIVSILPNSFSLSWEPPDNEYQNGILTGYTVMTVNDDTTIMTQSSTATNAVVSNLRPFTMYEVTIAAHNSAGRGPFSVGITIQTNETGG